jgi:hypothetical protein
MELVAVIEVADRGAPGALPDLLLHDERRETLQINIAA